MIYIYIIYIYIDIYIYIHTDCSSRVLLFVRSKMNPPGRRCLCGFRPPLRQGLRRAKRWARPRGFHAPHVKSGPGTVGLGASPPTSGNQRSGGCEKCES